MPLKVLNLAFVLFRGVPRGKRPQVLAAAGFGVDLPRIEPTLA
jgi:hypothetical protein